MTNKNGFISTSTSLLPTKLDMMLALYAVTITISMSRNKHLWFYLHFYKTYKNQTCQSLRPVSTDLTLQVTMTSPSLCHVTNIYDFISTSTRPIKTKLVRVLDQYLLTLPCRWQWPWLYPYFCKPKTLLGRLVKQHTLTLFCRWWRHYY